METESQDLHGHGWLIATIVQTAQYQESYGCKLRSFIIAHLSGTHLWSHWLDPNYDPPAMWNKPTNHQEKHKNINHKVFKTHTHTQNRTCLNCRWSSSPFGHCSHSFFGNAVLYSAINRTYIYIIVSGSCLNSFSRDHKNREIKVRLEQDLCDINYCHFWKYWKRERWLLAWSHPEELMKISWALLGKESAH